MSSTGRYGRLAAVLITPLTFHAQTRRAIPVGIDNYNPDRNLRARLERQALALASRPKVEGNATYWCFDNLDGAINDVALMKSALADLGVSDFFVPRSGGDGCRDSGALQKNLIDDAKAGEVRIFYYSGHCNHIRNLASREQGGEDQTIVPADNWRNVPDVRDKETSRILWQAARKGVALTLIADSCHSGSLSRGAWNALNTGAQAARRAETPGTWSIEVRTIRSVAK